MVNIHGALLLFLFFFLSAPCEERLSIRGAEGPPALAARPFVGIGCVSLEGY